METLKENVESEIDDTLTVSDIEKNEEIPEELKNSLEAPEETPNESIDIPTEDANTSNCLALTIQKEHRITAIKNVFLRSVRMSWKVAISAITLALIKLFS